MIRPNADEVKKIRDGVLSANRLSVIGKYWFDSALTLLAEIDALTAQNQSLTEQLSRKTDIVRRQAGTIGLYEASDNLVIKDLDAAEKAQLKIAVLEQQLAEITIERDCLDRELRALTEEHNCVLTPRLTLTERDLTREREKVAQLTIERDQLLAAAEKAKRMDQQ